ncbi:unnamed protein product, partial [Discosporangium mesarthrocarpum]
RVRRLRGWVVEEDTPGVPRRQDSSLGTIEGLLQRGEATGDEIIKALCSQKVASLVVGRGGVCG